MRDCGTAGLTLLQNNSGTVDPVHSGAASGLRTFLANVVISAAGLELVPPLSSDLKTVFGLNFKQVEREI